MKSLHGIAACVLMVAAVAAAAQTYPTRPVKIMVGANAGGGTDIIARMLGDKFQASMGQPFVVENKPGASNTIAADATAKAAARRLHAARRDQHRTGDRAASHQARLRHEQGPRARRADRGRAQRARRIAERAGHQRARPDRARQGQSGRSSRTAPRASAARSISPARRSTSPPAPRPCTCRTRGRRRRSPISSADRSSSTSTRRRRRWPSSRAARSRRSR